MEIKFAKIHPDAIIPQYMTEGAGAVDLAIYEEVTLLKKELTVIPLGYIAIPPKGYRFNIHPRSSTYKRYRVSLANQIGLIDGDYCGREDQLMLQLIAEEDITLPKGTRIAQMELVKLNQAKIVEVSLEDVPRKSRGGLGSTGC